jgi:hypothetical protein
MQSSRLFLIALITFLVVRASFGASESQGLVKAGVSEERPALDVALELRLTRTTQYKIRPGDTLARVSLLLYGHRTWWRKLQEQNPGLAAFQPDQTLPSGMVLKYLAPEVGENYVVQKNDWLIRIAQWRYGDSALWQHVFARNAESIKNPDLIHPGDRLYLGSDGTVENVSTGLTLAKGIRNVDPVRPARAIAAQTQGMMESAWIWSSERPFFFIGFFTGLIALLSMLLYALYKQIIFTPVAEAFGFHKHKGLPEEEEAEPIKPLQKSGYPHDFKKRAVEEPAVDHSLIRHEEPEIDLRPSYQRLFGRLKVFRKYLNRKKKE